MPPLCVVNNAVDNLLLFICSTQGVIMSSKTLLLPNDALKCGFSVPIEALHLVYNDTAMPSDLTLWTPEMPDPPTQLRHAYTTCERLAAFLFVADDALATSLIIHGWSQDVLNVASNGVLPTELTTLEKRKVTLDATALLGKLVVVADDGADAVVDADGTSPLKRARIHGK